MYSPFENYIKLCKFVSFPEALASGLALLRRPRRRETSRGVRVTRRAVELAPTETWRCDAQLYTAWKRCNLLPIGSVCMLYMVTLTINVPQMLAYIPYMDPMGNKVQNTEP